MKKREKRLINKSFKKTLLDSPVPNSKIKFFPSGNKSKTLKSKLIKLLPDPLQPTKYVPPVSPPKEKPVPKPRVLSKRPVPLPRSSPYPKPIAENVKKLIDEITPYYKPEAISAFNKIIRDKKSLRVKITEKSQAFKKRVKLFEVAVVESVDPAKQLYLTTTDVANELESLLLREGGMKPQVTLHITFKKKKIALGSEGQSEEVFEYKNAYFNRKAFTILNKEEIIDSLDKAAEEINNKIAVWLSEGSGWTIEVILRHYVNIVKYLPLRGNSYLQLPVDLRNSKTGLINIKNEDDKCFLWSHNRHLNPLKIHPERITQSDKELAKKLD